MSQIALLLLLCCLVRSASTVESSGNIRIYTHSGYNHHNMPQSYTYTSFGNWCNFPSTVSLYTIIWDVKGYMVTTKCNETGYVTFLLILPLQHLKNKLALKQIIQRPCFFLLTVRHISRSLVTTKWQ